ncbi:hypothetical protein Tco_0436242 [Tanacetum coccineum]
MHEVILFYKGLDVPTRKIIDSKGFVPSMNDANSKKAIQEMADYSQKWHNGTSIDARVKDSSLSLTEINQTNIPFPRRLREYGYDENEILKEFKKLQVSSNKSDTSIKRLLEEKWRIEEEIKAKMNEHCLTIIKDDLPLKERDPRSFTLPCTINNMHFNKALADLGSSKNCIVMKVYALGLGERMELDLEARLMGEALFLNRSRDHEFRDYIELNDLNEPLELRNHENKDLGPIIDEGEAIDELNGKIVKTRNDNVMVEKIYEYPSFCDYDRKIKDDCAYNLRFSCMIGYEHVNSNFFPILSINAMSKIFYNSIMKDKIEYKGKNVVRSFINMPIFIGDFSVTTDFAVVENMDNYHEEGMGDIIVGKLFYREVCVDARRSDRLITIYNDNSSVTY